MEKQGIGCLDIFVILLQIAFIVLKLCGVIAWNWVLVMLPLIILVGIYVVIILMCLIWNEDKFF